MQCLVLYPILYACVSCKHFKYRRVFNNSTTGRTYVMLIHCSQGNDWKTIRGKDIFSYIYSFTCLTPKPVESVFYANGCIVWTTYTVKITLSLLNYFSIRNANLLFISFLYVYSFQMTKPDLMYGNIMNFYNAYFCKIWTGHFTSFWRKNEINNFQCTEISVQ